MNNESEDGKRLSSVTNALRLLKVFSPEEPEMGLTVLAKRLGLANSTIHRLASALVAEGFLEQNPTNFRYRLGLSLFSLGTMVRRRMDVSNQGRPYLELLRERTNETVHLAVLDQTDVMYLYNMESDQAIRMRSYIGVRKPAFCTGEGCAILAFSPDFVIARVIAAGMRERTSKTNIDQAQFIEKLAFVRQHGYAIDDEESEEGMRAIAAPIRDSTGEVVAAAGMGGPVQRITKKKLRELIPLVVDTAASISLRLGYSA